MCLSCFYCSCPCGLPEAIFFHILVFFLHFTFTICFYSVMRGKESQLSVVVYCLIHGNVITFTFRTYCLRIVTVTLNLEEYELQHKKRAKIFKMINRIKLDDKNT